MSLVKFGLSRFRNYVNASWLDINDLTTIIGPNNEGKSNLCDALNIYFSFMFRRKVLRRSRIGENRTSYVLNRDYPILIKKGRKWPTKFIGIFNIDNEDKKYLPKHFKDSTSIEIIKQWSYDKNRFEYLIEGLSAKDVEKTVLYAFEKIKLISIPAIRDIRDLEVLLEEVFETTIEAKIESSRKINNIKDQLISLFEPEIKQTKKHLNSTLEKFLSRNISLDFDWGISVGNSIKLQDLIVDDGVPTNLNMKGDGIKSILQMALITQHSNIEKSNQSSFVYLLEEPESHLNSRFIHELKETIKDISKNAQVILTTHSPIFVNYFEFESNNLVMDGALRKPQNKSDIANALGIKIQENMKSNFTSIYFEGEDDMVAFKKILMKYKNKNKLVEKCDFIPSYSASKIPALISHDLSLYENMFVLLDNDKAGLEASDQIKKISSNIPQFIIPLEQGFFEAEMEDLLTFDCQAKIFTKYFNRQFSVSTFSAVKKRSNGKWSNWITKVTNHNGLNIKSSDSIKGILWDNEDDLELTANGIEFLNNLILSIERVIK